jgi:hypothetical protein
MGSMTRAEKLRPEDFEAIREAVMETPRGRWFLEQYAEKLRSADSAAMLAGMQRLEATVAANQDTLLTILARALANAEARPAASPPQAEPVAQSGLAPKHMKYFRQDEEIFEPAAQATIAAVPEAAKPHEWSEARSEVKPAAKPEAPKGAKVIIRRTESVTLEAAPEPPAPAPEPPPATAAAVPDEAPAAAAPQPRSEAEPKRRIVIIRHKPGEDIDVPLQDDIAKAS